MGVKGNISIWFTGIDELIKQVDRDAQKVLEDLDRDLEEYANNLAKEMSDRAPILTGALRRSLLESPRREGFLHFQLWTSEDVPYAYFQNREHATAAGFITIPRNKARDDFPRWIVEKARG